MTERSSINLPCSMSSLIRASRASRKVGVPHRVRTIVIGTARGSIRPDIVSSNVVLPAPFGPMSATIDRIELNRRLQTEQQRPEIDCHAVNNHFHCRPGAGRATFLRPSRMPSGYSTRQTAVLIPPNKLAIDLLESQHRGAYPSTMVPTKAPAR